MTPSPFLGVFFHWLGGLAAGSFYVPYRGVKKWAWEVYWLVGGFFSWIIAPWIVASVNTRDLLGVLGQTSASTFAWTWFWGAMWGLGGLTFGLTVRYLGLSLGVAVALGYCAAFGTLMPPLFHGEFASKVLATTSGRFVLLGVGICLAGIALAGWAGLSKERELTDDERKATIKEFNFGRGILVGTFCGVMSACFAYALDAAAPIAEASLARGTPQIWTGLPKLIVVLLGGFTSNFVWCAILNVRNRTAGQYFSSTLPSKVPGRDEETIIETAVDAPSEEVVEHIPWPKRNGVARVPLAANYFWSALAGVTWYMQFFFYTMGETQMGAYKFSSWTLHMASIIIFSSLWGIFLREWRGSSASTRAKLGLALATLILSTIVVGYGNYLGSSWPSAPPLGAPVPLQGLDEAVAGEPSHERVRRSHPLDANGIPIPGERDLVPGLEAHGPAKGLRDDLTLATNPMSHTSKYNSERPLRELLSTGRRMGSRLQERKKDPAPAAPRIPRWRPDHASQRETPAPARGSLARTP